MREPEWGALMGRLGLAESLGQHASLLRAYSESHRHYHTLAHLDDCLARLSEVRDDVPKPDEVELALWFHDAVYKTRSGTNEQESADLAQAFLEQSGAGSALIEAVRDHILATCHDGDPERPGSKWMVDVDLAILGQDRAHYARFERDVRKEYWWVPRSLFVASARPSFARFSSARRFT